MTNLTEINAAIDRMLEEVKDGWATPSKAHEMAELIAQVHPKLCVEIGVFGGRSLLAQAVAMRELSPDGLTVGIDPWRKDATVEGAVGDANAEWWGSLNMNDIHRDFMDHLWRLNLNKRCLVIRSSSEDCVDLFQKKSIDILHIDGNHSPEVSCRDVKMWLPKVSTLGHVWFDDVDWESTQPAIRLLDAKCICLRTSENSKLFQLTR